MKALKAQKAALTRQRSQQKECRLRQSGAERRQMEVVQTNVGEILKPGQAHDRPCKKEWIQPCSRAIRVQKSLRTISGEIDISSPPAFRCRFLSHFRIASCISGTYCPEIAFSRRFPGRPVSLRRAFMFLGHHPLTGCLKVCAGTTAIAHAHKTANWPGKGLFMRLFAGNIHF